MSGSPTVALGDEVTRTNARGVVEKVNLPTIDRTHLTEVTAVGGRVDGFHVLPASVGPVMSNTPVVIPAGSVRILDGTGTLIVGATVEVTPLCIPASVYDALEARVRVLDSSGGVVASGAAKTFFPQAWNDGRIQQAIYSAYVRSFQSGGAPFGVRLLVTTPQGVKLFLRVNGTQTASGITLAGISTAYLLPGQRLTAAHAP